MLARLLAVLHPRVVSVVPRSSVGRVPAMEPPHGGDPRRHQVLKRFVRTGLSETKIAPPFELGWGDLSLGMRWATVSAHALGPLGQ